MSTEPKRRRKVFVRRETDPLRLTPHDIGILRDVAEYRFLNTEQILALNLGGKRNLLRRLAGMFDHQYLRRHKTGRLHSMHLTYSLGRRGAEELAKDAPEREGLYRRIRESERTSSIIAHALMISQFKVCLTLALKDRDDVKLTKWMQGDDLKRALSAHGALELVPDALFVLEGADWTYPFFLEADRGTMGHKTYLSKLRVYWRWFKDERLEKTLGFKYFRVLTITPMAGRCENLRLTAKEADDKRTGSPLFLFAPETTYNIANPRGLLESVWRSPKDDTPHSIIE